MDTHKNVPLTPKGRDAMVRSVSEGRSCPWCGLDMARRARGHHLGSKDNTDSRARALDVLPAFPELQRYPFKRSHLVALRANKIPITQTRSTTPSAIAGVVRGASWTRQRL